MLKNIINSIIKIPSTRLFVTAPSSSIANQSSSLSNALEKYKSPLVTEPREVWLENFDTEETQRLGLVTLHPEVFADTPRIDIVQRNVHWQRMYQFVSFAHSKTRAEKRGGGMFTSQNSSSKNNQIN
jgi:large subunit ribosomal protein L4